MDPSSRKKRNPEVDLRVYTNAVDVSNGSPSPCAKSRSLAGGFYPRLSFRYHECVNPLKFTVGIGVGLGSCGGASDTQLRSKQLVRPQGEVGGVNPSTSDDNAPVAPGDDAPSAPVDDAPPAPGDSGAAALADADTPIVPDDDDRMISGDAATLIPGDDAPATSEVDDALMIPECQNVDDPMI